MKKQVKGKHFTSNKKAKSSHKKVILLILIVALVFLTIFIFTNNQNKDSNSNTKNTTQNQVKIIEEDIINMPDTMGEYNVLGVIAIEKLGIAKNILDKTTDESLNLSVTKFYGPDINTEGNFCITGHNYKDVFAYADQLELEDTFYIVDKATQQKVTYKIYDKYTVDPTELDCLNQETDGKKEVTLITCNPGGLTRLIIKAQEI